MPSGERHQSCVQCLRPHGCLCAHCQPALRPEPLTPCYPNTILQLINEAHHRWLVEEDGVVDDITAVIVHLTHPGHAPAAAQPREAQ